MHRLKNKLCVIRSSGDPAATTLISCTTVRTKRSAASKLFPKIQVDTPIHSALKYHVDASLTMHWSWRESVLRRYPEAERRVKEFLFYYNWSTINIQHEQQFFFKLLSSLQLYDLSQTALNKQNAHFCVSPWYGTSLD